VVFLSDLGDKIVIIEIIYYLLHVVIIGRGVGLRGRRGGTDLWKMAVCCNTRMSNALSLAFKDQGTWKSVAVSLCRELGAVREAGWVKQAQNM
jgi:hypothetical protein